MRLSAVAVAIMGHNLIMGIPQISVYDDLSCNTLRATYIAKSAFCGNATSCLPCTAVTTSEEESYITSLKMVPDPFTLSIDIDSSCRESQLMSDVVIAATSMNAAKIFSGRCAPVGLTMNGNPVQIHQRSMMITDDADCLKLATEPVSSGQPRRTVLLPVLLMMITVLTIVHCTECWTNAVCLCSQLYSVWWW